MNLASSDAAWRAGERLAAHGGSIRASLESLGIPGLDLDAVAEWGDVSIDSAAAIAEYRELFASRVAGMLAAAMILAVELEREHRGV